MSNLRPIEGKATSTLILRAFRPVVDGASKAWDLVFVEVHDEASTEALELPEWLEAYEEPAEASVGGAPALTVTQRLDDRVLVSAARSDNGRPWLSEEPGWLRQVKLSAREGRAELAWIVRVEGGPELATPIAEMWLLSSVVHTSQLQLELPLEEGKGKGKPPRLSVLPPEPDDEGREHDRPDAPPAPPRRKRRTT